MKIKKIIFHSVIFVAAVVMSTLFSLAVSTAVYADELAGYWAVDWEQCRDLETTSSNSVTLGGEVEFWRYVNNRHPAYGATWKFQLVC